MHTLPKEDRETVVRLLLRLPGVEGTAGRRRLISLLWPTDLTDLVVDDREIEKGWDSVVAWISQRPAAQSTVILRAFLRNLGAVFSNSEFLDEISDIDLRLSMAATNRSFPAFLARIGLEAGDDDASGVLALDRAFVPPTQYDSAREIFSRSRVLFLLGDPHMGKTFCAIHLLWEQFRDHGVEPYWLRSPVEPNLDLAPSGAPISDGAAIYVEDPFGRVSPIEDPEAVFTRLRRLLIVAEQRRHLVVVTSRTAVLQAAIADRLRDYVVELSQELLLECSYEASALLDIAERYIEIYRPRWAENDRSGHLATAITAELRAPHNIQEFVLATRSLSEPADALNRLRGFKDVVNEYVAVFTRLEDWIATALVVVSAASDQHLNVDELGKLYDRLNPNRLPYKHFRAALDELTHYLTFVGEQYPLVRHPSIEEAADAMCRQSPSLLEAAWILVAACRDPRDAQRDKVAVRLLARFADRWARIPGRLAILEDYFDNADLDVRAMSRRLALNQFSELPAEAADIVADMAMRSWSDRFLVQLVLAPSTLGDQRYSDLALKLAASPDGHTRYVLAENLRRLKASAIPRVLHSLIQDSDGLVSRKAIYEAITHGPVDADLEEKLAATLAILPQRHLAWLRTIVPKSPLVARLLA